MQLKKLINILETIAPNNLKEDFDNVGLLVGDTTSNIKTILVTLDITYEVVIEAIDKKVDLIIAHHPLIRAKSISTITNTTPLGAKLIKLIKNNIAVFAMHTNLDKAVDGTNDILFKKLMLKEKQYLDDESLFGKVGKLEKPMIFKDYCLFVKQILNLSNMNVCGDLNKEIKKVGLCTGSCSNYDFFKKALLKDCDCYITGDIKHHDAIDAAELGLNLIDGTHHETEILFADVMCAKLDDIFKQEGEQIIVIKTTENKPIFNIL